MNLKFYTPMVAGLLMLSACSQSASNGNNEDSGTTEGISNFEVKQTVKTLERTYACKGLRRCLMIRYRCLALSGWLCNGLTRWVIAI